MKKLLLLSFILFIGCYSYSQFTDNMESYTDGQPISGAWWTDNSCGGGTGCAIMSSSAEAHGGSLSGLIPNDSTTDAVLDLGNKLFNLWDMEFWMYVPSNKEAYWTIKGSVPIGASTDVGHFFFNQNNDNPGEGLITDIALGDVIFDFPHDEWFNIVLIVDILSGINSSTWGLYINNVEIIPYGTPFTNEFGDYPDSLGGIEFFSISSVNTYYLDDFYFSDPLIGFVDFSISDFNIYPNPVKDLLTINNTNTTQITSLKLYDVLGRLVMTKEGNVSEIDLSHLNSGVLFIKIETAQGVITKKIIKE